MQLRRIGVTLSLPLKPGHPSLAFLDFPWVWTDILHPFRGIVADDEAVSQLLDTLYATPASPKDDQQWL